MKNNLCLIEGARGKPFHTKIWYLHFLNKVVLFYFLLGTHLFCAALETILQCITRLEMKEKCAPTAAIEIYRGSDSAVKVHQDLH